jgi:hypothetical protein
VRVPARALGKPVADLLGFVPGVIVRHEMHFEVAGTLASMRSRKRRNSVA